ncbi:MAG TPA: PAS domain S-box protein [Thermoguttaceae bacterium]|nr:PAS domain S-box protein [Thermoguttaceae bacterium]
MATLGDHKPNGNSNTDSCPTNPQNAQTKEEGALRQSSDFLQTVIDAIPELTVVIDRDYRVLFANRAAREKAGGMDPVAACLACYQLSHHRDTPCQEEPCPLKQILETKQPVTVEHTHYDADNNEVYVEISAAPILDETGEVVQIIQASRDITDRKRAEIELRESEERFRTVVEASKDAVIAINRDGLVIIFNRAAEEMFGHRRESMIDQPVDCLMPEEYRERHRQGGDSYFSRGKPGTSIGRIVELPALRNDGHVFPVEMSLSAAQIGDGPVVLATIRDITDRKQVEEKLQSAKDISDATLKSLPGIFYAFDEQGHFLRWNTNLEEISGYSADEIVRMHPLDFIAPQDKKSTADRIQEVFAKGQSVVEAHFLTRDGRELPFHFTGVRCEIDGKQCLLGTGLDISERKQAEESLQKSEQRFRSLVETTSDWIWEVDQDGIYTYASPKVKDLLGYEPEDVVGKTAFDFMLPDEAQRVIGVFQRACESRRSFAQIENRNLHKDGRTVVLETSGVPIIDNDGKLRGYRGVDRDVTERKIVAEALRKSEEKYRVLFEESADATLIIHGNRFVDCNDAVVEMLGYRSKAELLSAHPSELSPEIQPDGRLSYEKAEEMMAIAFEKGSHRFEWDHKRADGEVFPVEVLLTAIPSEDSKILYVVWRDITDRKRAEKEREDLIARLEAQNAELERFTYTVSHDLKSPLITLKGFLGILKEDLAIGDTKAIADDMGRMSSAADKMARLLNELLELSRIGRVVNPLEDVAIGEIAREAVELVQGQITQQGMQVEIADNLPILFGDRLRLVEVLQNLIENAVKCTAARPDPRIEIGVRLDNHETVCYVRDNGVGIDRRYHEKVFNLFEKLDPKSDGTGVGLALVKRIIEVHGGRIWVESEGAGHGSAFCFTLPQRPDAAG